MSNWNKQDSIQNALSLIMKGISEEQKNLVEHIDYLTCYDDNIIEVEAGISKIKFLVEMLEENFKKYKALEVKEVFQEDTVCCEDDVDDIPF